MSALLTIIGAAFVVVVGTAVACLTLIVCHAMVRETLRVVRASDTPAPSQASGATPLRRVW